MIRIKVGTNQTFWINGVEMGVNRATIVEVLGDADEIIFPSGRRMTNVVEERDVTEVAEVDTES